MEDDREPGAGPTGLAPPLKRKKTVTWAEDDELELPLGPPGGAAEGAAAAAAAPVVVLPCDGLFDALTADLLEQQEELPAAAGEEPLSQRQLLERRLAHTDQLASLYQAELWALAEELRLRHTQFVAQRGEQAVWKGGGGGGGGQQQQRADEDTEMADADVEGQAAAEQQPQQQPQQQGGSQAQPAAAGGEAAALRALWEERQQQEQGAGAAAQQEAQQGGGEQDVKQPQQGAGRQQAEGKPDGKPGRKGDKAAAAGDKTATKRGGQAAAEEGGSKAGKAESKAAAAKDKQQAGAEGKAAAASGKQAAGAEAGGKPAGKQAAGSKQPSSKNAPAGEGTTQQAAAPAEAGPEGVAAAGTAPEPPAAPEQLPPLPPQPRFEDVEALLLSGAAAGLPPVDEAALVEARARFVRRLDQLGRLEQSALSTTARQLDALGGLALLCGRRCRYILRRSAVAIGRSSGSQGKVDVDLAHEGGAAAQRVSRHQAQLWLEPDGGFRLRCTGRRPMWVNGQRLEQGQAAALPTLSHVAVGGVSLLFVANVAAAQRGAARAAALLAP